MHSIDPGSVERTPVLVADEDSAVLALASSALSRAGYVVRVAQNGDAAVKLSDVEPRPSVVIVDWTLTGADAAQFCQQVRASHTRGYTYIIALAANGRRAEAVHALEVGADEYLMKPFAVEELVARVGWAQRMLAAVPTKSRRLRSVLEAAARAEGGEVVVTHGETVGRIFFDGGYVIWAHLSTHPVTVTSLFEDVAELGEDEVSEVLEETKRTGQNFVEVLIQWGLVSQEKATEVLRRSIRETVQALFDLEDPQIVFAPGTRRTWFGPKFALTEVIPPESLRPPPTAEPPSFDQVEGKVRCQFMPRCNTCGNMAATLSVELRESGADGIAIVHRPSGTVLASAGERIDEDIIRATLHILGVLSNDDEADDILVSGAGKHYLLRSTACPDAFVSMMASRRNTSLGTVRHELTRIASKICPEETVKPRRQSSRPAVDTPKLGRH
jgi:CheY-like chemotaxis protein